MHIVFSLFIRHSDREARPNLDDELHHLVSNRAVILTHHINRGKTAARMQTRLQLCICT